jgi:hypothetical protein
MNSMQDVGGTRSFAIEKMFPRKSYMGYRVCDQEIVVKVSLVI